MQEEGVAPENLHHLVPVEYGAQLPRLTFALNQAWDRGRHWAEADPEERGRTWQVLVEELGVGVPGRLVRAYQRLVTWERVLAFVVPRGVFSLWYGFRDRQFLTKQVDDDMMELARQYLVEWRICGLLPRNEGLLIARE